MLTARTDKTAYVEATEAVRDQAYRCRGCGAPVTLKAGRVRIAHFAHRPDATCAFGQGMTIEHLAAQKTLAAALRARGVVAELEAWLPGLMQDRRIDVLAHPAGRPRRRIALEVQRADLAVLVIQARTASYQAQGVAPLWLRLLDFGRLAEPQYMPRRGGVWVARYAPRAWERWAHDELLRRLWFWDGGAERLWRGQFVPAFARRLNPAGLPVWTRLFRVSGLALEGPYRPEELRLQRGRDAGGAATLSAWFVAPGDPPRAAAVPAARPHVTVQDRLDFAGVDSFVAGRWVREPLAPAPPDWRTARSEPHADPYRGVRESEVYAIEDPEAGVLFLLD